MKKENKQENPPDTRGVVHSVKGHVVYGRIAGQKDFNGRSPTRNPMVSGNSGLKKRG
jgi:hypothetical protein